MNFNYNSNRIVLKAKKIISLALFLMIFSILVLTVVFIISAQRSNTVPHDKVIVDAVGFNGDGSYISESVYNSNDNFYISSLNEFLSFNESLGRYDFYKKRVSLYCNIDLSSIAWNPWGTFCGMFEGNGYTIKGTGKTKSINNGNNFYVGVLFSSLGGSKWQESHWVAPDDYYDCFPYVKNLRLEDFYLNTCGYWGVSGLLSCKVFGDMQISNISVANCIVEIPSGSSPVDVGGIVGVVPYDETCHVTIQDCEVINLSITSQVEGDIAAIVGTVESESDSNVLTIDRCVVKNFQVTSKNSGTKIDTYTNACKAEKEYFLGMHTKTKFIYKSHSEAKFLTLQNYCDTAKTSIDAFEDWGNVVSIVDSNKWFFDSTFNDGFPKLQFWLGKKARFYIYPRTKTEEGYVEIDEFNVFDSYYAFQPDPKDKTCVEDIIDIDSSTTELKIGDKILTATPSQDKYEFDKWEYLYVPAGTKYNNRDYDFDIHVYTAKFKLKKCKVTFVANALAEFSGVTSVDIIQDNKITITRILNADNTFTYEYTMTNANDEKVTVQYKLKHPKHTMKGVEETGEITVTGTTLTIKPEFEPKNYDINLG